MRVRLEEDVTDVVVAITDDGSAGSITFLTTAESDRTMLLARPLLVRLRSQIADELSRTAPPAKQE